MSAAARRWASRSAGALLLCALAAGAAPKDLPRTDERALRDGRYALVHSDSEGRRDWQYWWSERRHDCQLLAFEDDRFRRRESTSETDCDQWRDDPRMSERGRVALAAARELRTDRLRHRSHERDVRRYDKVHEVAWFERGYRDGMEGRRAQTRDGGSAYADGYRAGERRAHRPPVVRPPGGGTPPPSVVVPVTRPVDLVGRGAGDLEPAMRALGYQPRGGFEKGRESFITWRGAGPWQCIRSVVRDGRIQAMDDLPETDCQP